jgi:hypothetical protein
VDGIRGDADAVSNGTPQGSPVSPVLSSYYTSDLLDIFDDGSVHFPDVAEQPVQLSLYVDDGQLCAVSPSCSTNASLLENAYGLVHMWMFDNGLQLDKEKHELMHFKRGAAALNPVTLPNFDGSITQHAPSSVVRWLGIFFDPKLNFKQHVKIMAVRAKSNASALSILGNSQ